jgi:glycosidase
MPGGTITVGKLYLRECESKTQLAEIRKFVETLGFFPPVDGTENNGVMYSCHPHGTMDTNFKSLKEDLFQFAKRLPGLKKMGIEHLWILPVFDHDEKGVYHSNDQDIIDARYGGEEAARHYGEKARELGINLLYDYVPHGPVPTHPLALNNPSWCAKRRDGGLQIEWDCVSMDYNNEEYLSYIENLVRGHVKRFGVGGARIDCAMGGLSNWRPVAGLRPSASSIRAGVHISGAIRRGFIKEGVKPLNMPENFHPIPPYYAQTDVFYGFNLYRVFCELEPLFKENPGRYCAELTEWLKAENEVLPKNLRKLRFLGNHDTVTWVWQKRRAAAIYGTEGAKALWALISLIDGIPMIYQGDEDPSLYNAEGENLAGFCTELFLVRKKTSGDIGYIETGTAVFAFKRGEKTLVMVNLSDGEQSFGGHNLAPYQYKVVEL